jgi:hypothetical protein
MQQLPLLMDQILQDMEQEFRVHLNQQRLELNLASV